MDTKKYTIHINGIAYAYPQGTTYGEIAEALQPKYEHQIVLVLENTVLRELHRTIKDGAEVTMVTTADDSGHKSYKRSLNLMLFKAIKDVTGLPEIPRIVQVLSISNGYFYQMHGDQQPDAEFLQKVKARMQELTDAELPIVKDQVPLKEARAI